MTSWPLLPLCPVEQQALGPWEIAGMPHRPGSDSGPSYRSPSTAGSPKTSEVHGEQPDNRWGNSVLAPLPHNLRGNHSMGHSPGAQRAVHLWIPVSSKRLTCCVTSRNCRTSLNLSDHPICKDELLLAPAGTPSQPYCVIICLSWRSRGCTAVGPWVV